MFYSDANDYCYPLDSAMPLDDLEQQHKQNTAILTQCRVQCTMLGVQRELLAKQVQKRSNDLTPPKLPSKSTGYPNKPGPCHDHSNSLFPIRNPLS